MGKLTLPIEPMAPIYNETIPLGDDWVYQLKWDGVRLLARVENGRVELFSRRGLSKNATYPELVEILSEYNGSFIVDGEVVVVDEASGRPVFQKVLQRERSRSSSAVRARYPIIYVLFDLLEWNEESWMHRPFTERDAALRSLFPERQPELFVTDSFPDGNALWSWVEQHGWEGIVSKRVSSIYRFGKKHQDWFKKKTRLVLEVDIVGITIKEGRVSSLVMVEGESLEAAPDGARPYRGKVSIGLNSALRQALHQYANEYTREIAVFPKLPTELKGDRIIWLTRPLAATVQGQEITAAGLLRHPQLISLDMEGAYS